MSVAAHESGVVGLDPATRKRREWREPSYWPFVAPAMIVVLAVIIFPWAYTLWMSLHAWKVG